MNIQLNEQEARFCLGVYLAFRLKIGAAGVPKTQGVPVWVRPEEAGLIRSVGAFKWEATDKLRLFLVQSLLDHHFDQDAGAP